MCNPLVMQQLLGTITGQATVVIVTARPLPWMVRVAAVREVLMSLGPYLQLIPVIR